MKTLLTGGAGYIGIHAAVVLNQAKPNQLMRLRGPSGTFFLRDVAGLELVLLATGTGMAHIKALLEGLAQMHE